jgi:lipid-A-disaccharide synthase
MQQNASTPDATPHIYMVAGEHSGDQLGGRLIAALKNLTPIRLSGLGGSHMQAQGLTSLFPMEDIGVIGIAEVLPHVFRLKRRIREVADDIEARRPDIVITIDAPGFNYRVMDILRDRNYTASRFIHYVAPTVWAYRPKRAANTARLFDGLMTLFAFEVPYFTACGLNTRWVGHEAAWHATPKDSAIIDENLLAAFAGSRRNELKRHIPLFREVASILSQSHPSLKIVMPLPESLHAYAQSLTQHWPCPLTLCDASERETVLKRAKIALCKSGTISLECALSSTPMVITYRANPISAWVVRRTLRTKFVGLPNILLGREAVPEYIQERATADAIANALSILLTSNSHYQTQQQELQSLKTLLLPSAEKSPSEIAAQYIASFFTPHAA